MGEKGTAVAAVAAAVGEEGTAEGVEGAVGGSCCRGLCALPVGDPAAVVAVVGEPALAARGLGEVAAAAAAAAAVVVPVLRGRPS